MEEQITPNDLFDLEIEGSTKKLLKEVSFWARVVAATAIVSYVLAIANTLFIYGSIGANVLSYSNTMMGLAYTAGVTAIGILMNVFLFRFGAKTKEGIDHLNQQQLELGFASLKIYYKIVGILSIIVIVGVVLIIFITVARI